MSDNSDRSDGIKRMKDYIETVLPALGEGDIGPASGFTPGAQIEVLWTVLRSPSKDEQTAESKAQQGEAEPIATQQSVDDTQEDGEADEEDVWWPARVVGRTSRFQQLRINAEEVGDEGAPEQLPIYEIIYDARPPDFPRPERSPVCILDEHHLLVANDDEDQPVLPWRCIGSNWEPNEAEPDENTIPESLRDIMRLAEEHADGSASNLPEEVSEQLASTFVQQVIGGLASHYQDALAELPDGSREALGERVERFQSRLIEELAQLLRTPGDLTPEALRNLVRKCTQ